MVEYPWVIRNMPSSGRVLDVGSAGSQLPLMLLGLGYEVWTIDVRGCEHENVSRFLHCVKGDIRETDFPHSFFDVVLAVSTIEHIGLGRYGDAVDTFGDIKAINETKRILDSDGVLLMTVPFGKRAITKNHRVYNKASLSTLLKDFQVGKIDYFLRSDRSWAPSSIDEVQDADSVDSDKAIACVRATNIKGPKK
jgi:SAM-dependent methyltransferase